MFYVSEIFTPAPETFQTPLQERTYAALAALGLPYERVETDEAITMEDCVQIDEKLQMKIVKTLFLCVIPTFHCSARNSAELILRKS